MELKLKDSKLLNDFAEISHWRLAMKPRLYRWILFCALVCLTGLWTAPAAGRLNPPVQEIDWAVENSGTTIRFWLKNISFFGNTEDTWAVPPADVRQIVSVHADKGILTWIAQYKNTADYSLANLVVYCIYDPGRGQWIKQQWGPLGPGNSVDGGSWIDQPHQVVDGVVAWVAHRGFYDNRAMMEHSVCYATYDPKLGSFTQGQLLWQVPYFTSKYAPDELQIKNGVVAWPMKNANSGYTKNENALDIFYTIYDQELHKWQEMKYSWSSPAGFDRIKILDDTLVVDLQYSNWYLGELHEYMFYDPTAQKWDLSYYKDYAVKRRAFFVALPNVGFIPFTTCFWDCSYALDGVNTLSAWNWDMEGSYFSTDRSPVLNLPYLASLPGPFDRIDDVTEHVTYNDTGTVYTYKSQIREGTPPPPTGYININNDAAYTNSANVTLSLNYEASATEMHFRQVPGRLQYTAWEPVNHSKAWTLSTIHEVGTSPDGPRTVYVQFQDQYGQPSPEYPATITLVTTPPAAWLVLYNGPASIYRNVQALAWAASNYSLEWSCAACEVAQTGLVWGVWWTPWADYGLPLYAVVPFSSPSGQKPMMIGLVQFKDIAGNVTQVQAGIVLKPPPLGHLRLLLIN